MTGSVIYSTDRENERDITLNLSKTVFIGGSRILILRKGVTVLWQQFGEREIRCQGRIFGWSLIVQGNES